MSLYKRKQIVKNKFDNIQKISNASIRTEVRDSNHSEIYLDINGIFKRIDIEYIGNIYDIFLEKKGLKLYYNTNRGKITISNPSQLAIDNKALLRYVGKIYKFKNVKVFGWGQRAVLATRELPSHIKVNINNNDNVVGTSSEIIKRFNKEGMI